MKLGNAANDLFDSPVRPVLEGDVLEERKVAGFAWAGQFGETASTHLDDRLLFDGDEHLEAPPDRFVPQTADAATTLAVMPPNDLPPAEVHVADSLHPALSLRADRLLDLPAAPWRPLIRPLMGAVRATGHRIWLAGGAVRDLVTGAPPSQVRDLDLSGTVPPGRFTDITHQMLRALGMAELRTTVCPTSLVCSVVAYKPTDRLIEYRGLTKGLDRGADLLVDPEGDREPYPRPAAGGDDFAGAERRVGPDHDRTARQRRPGGQHGLGGDDGLGDQPGGTASRAGVARPKLGRGDDRCRLRVLIVAAKGL
jgi:hypothetical protein